MKQNSILAVLGLALAAASPSLTFAANGTPSTTAEQSRADTILRQMSNTLGAAQYFSFKVDREIDPPLAKKLGLQERTRIEVAVRRPDKLVALSTSKADVRKLFADGRQLTVFDVKQNLYSTVPMPASLDALPAKLAEKYGFAPPRWRNSSSAILTRTSSGVSRAKRTSELSDAAAVFSTKWNAIAWLSRAASPTRSSGLPSPITFPGN